MTLDTTRALPIVRTINDLRSQVFSWRRAGDRVGFVPTMGALHAGHLSLVEMAKARANRIVVSLFVNPAQFAPNEDFERYPRNEAGDLEKLSRQAYCDLVYLPAVKEMYPDGFSTAVRVAGVSEGLESAARPHFFGGVATVVTKLLMQVQPDIAIFGEKDYQQLLVIKRLVKDLDLPVEIVGGATLREHDGLAMSSRNAYLSAGERKSAAWLNIILQDAARDILAGKSIPESLAIGTARLLKQGFGAVDYLELRDAHTLAPLAKLDRPGRLLVAARVGGTRLIDNWPVDPVDAA